MKKLLWVGVVFLVGAVLFVACGKDYDFIVEKDGVVIKGVLTEGSKLSAEAGEIKAETALSMSQPSD